MVIRRLAAGVLCCCCCLVFAPSQSFGIALAVDVVNAEFMWQQGYTGEGIEIGVIDLHFAQSSHPVINTMLASKNREL